MVLLYVTNSVTLLPTIYASCFIGNQLIAAGGAQGGYDGSGSVSTSVLNEVWVSSDFGVTWMEVGGSNSSSSKAKIPWEPRADFKMVVLPGGDYSLDRLVITGGLVNATANKMTCDTWFVTNVTDCANTKNRCDGTNWVKSYHRLDRQNSCAPWGKRNDFGMALFKGKIFLMGGIDESGQFLNDLWQLNSLFWGWGVDSNDLPYSDVSDGSGSGPTIPYFMAGEKSTHPALRFRGN